MHTKTIAIYQLGDNVKKKTNKQTKKDLMRRSGAAKKRKNETDKQKCNKKVC